MNIRPRFEVIHNIPSPYRVHLFNKLSARSAERGYLFHVHFMAHTHSDRSHWASHSGLAFSHSFSRDLGPAVRGKKWHLNLRPLAHLAADPPRVLMVGGPWDSLTGIIASMLAPRSRSIAWIEGNTKSPGRVSGIALRAKESLLRRYACVAVPGAEGRAYVGLVAPGLDPKRVVVLPNLVDEERFRGPVIPKDIEAIRDLFGVDAGCRLAVWPARLIPDKGICPFLAALEPEVLTNWKIAILGEGPLREEIDAIVRSRGLSKNVTIRPSLSYDEMPAFYRAGDLFLLPSVSDKNPLSVVEALHSGLPVAVSNRIGNLPEAVREGDNGWVLDVSNVPAMRSTLKAVFSSSSERLVAMGAKSRAVAVHFWSSARAIESFLDTALADP